MADILIQGIEMPKSGYIEMLLKVSDGEIYYNYAGDKEIKHADFIPLPEGYGRLIDADALLERLMKTSRYFDLKYDINAAPTIVSKEGGKIE